MNTRHTIRQTESSLSESTVSETSDNTSYARQTYDEANGEKTLLMAMAIGLTSNDDENRILGDLSVSPWNASYQKRSFTPRRQQLTAEVIRRIKNYGFNEGKVPRCKNWSREMAYQWLLENPITKEEDVKFIREEELKFYKMIESANTEATKISRAITGNTIVWSNIADMRLIHCLTVDEVKEAFLKRHDIFSRRQLDAFHGPNRIPTFEEVLSDKYNDSNFKPFSLVLPSLHSDFSISQDLSFDKVPCAVTPEHVKRWLADRKTKLIIMINKWERSGNGGGNRVNGEEGFGEYNEEFEFQDDDDRSNFLNGNRTTLLYYWHVAVENNLLESTLSILPDEMSATSSATATPVFNSRQNKRKKNDVNMDRFPIEVIDGFKNLTKLYESEDIKNKSEQKKNCIANIQQCEQRLEEYMKKFHECEEGNFLRQFYEERMHAAKIMLDEATADYHKLKG